jgi:23S rRNA (cytidine1920-2'-O)/16S rRNA (cytidine1409-2'-O)-methyltransferase
MRADKFFADKFGSRTKSAEAIEKGLVLVNGKTVRAKDEIKDTDDITFVQAEETFVSNGGYKLNRALLAWNFDCKDKIFADIGASTGGFTDCLLQRNAKKIYTVDVGESLLAPSLLKSGKIVQMENTNARYLEKTDFADELDGVVVDVSFISLKWIFPTVKKILKENGDAFLLIKPQFECEKKNIGKSGIVHTSAHGEIVKKVVRYALDCGLYPMEIINAPVRKGKNIEYVIHCKPTYENARSVEQIVSDVQTFLKNRETT